MAQVAKLFIRLCNKVRDVVWTLCSLWSGCRSSHARARQRTCSVANCLKKAHYAPIGNISAVAELCHEHGHGRTGYHPKWGGCISEGCTRWASFGTMADKDMLYCAEHAKDIPNCVNLRLSKCTFPGCEITAWYGANGTTIRTHCSKHGKPLGLVCLYKLECALCEKVPSFAAPGTRKPTHCAVHKPPNYIGTTNKYCIFGEEGKKCTTLASFGPPDTMGSEKALYCKEHKLEGYYYVLGKLCSMCVEEKRSCPKQVSFGFLGVQGSSVVSTRLSICT